MSGSANEAIVVAAFYKFVSLDDFGALQQPLKEQCESQGVRGSVLLASEGINGTLAGSRQGLDAVFAWLRADPRLGELEVKESFSDAMPFLRLKVRLKKEIVTFRQAVDPTVSVGTYVEPDDWNSVISDPDVFVIDTRNEEEIELGTFAGAVNPNTQSFTEFADYVATLDPAEHPKVAMFCTGGIRCEKASAHLLNEGFDQVMHLRGGILKYLEDVPADESMWEGECFVFDERVSVDHDLRPGAYTLCRGCRRPVAPKDKNHPGYEDGVSCEHCVAGLTEARAERLRERNRQVTLAEARGLDHIARKA